MIGKEEKNNEYIPTAKAVFQVLKGTNIRINEEHGKSILTLLELFETNFEAMNPEYEMKGTT